MSHGNYICSKCGAVAFSKCINQRTTFQDDQTAALIRSWACITDRRTREAESITRAKVTVTSIGLEIDIVTRDGEDPDKQWHGKLKYIADLPENQFRRVFCSHDWQINPDSACDFGCCIGKDYYKESQP